MNTSSVVSGGRLAVGPLAADKSTSAAALAGWLIAGAVLFNFFLAFVNANIMALGSREVILVEGLILASTHLLVFAYFRTSMMPWYALIWFLSMIAAARWSWLGHVDPKSFRDTLIIPTFVALGLAAGDKSLNRTVIWIQIAVLTVALVEALSPDLYSSLIKVKQYYINTRGFEEEAFWNQSSDLFVSATRPQDRSFFPSLALHRVSSVFLEPVSLGNYCTIITAFICGRFSSLSWKAIAFLAISNFILLIACDGRLAVNASALIIIVSFLAPYLPYSCILYLPIAAAAAFLIHALVGWSPGADNFVGRVAFTAELLQDMPFAAYMGVGPDDPSTVIDSGLAYWIQTQSIGGVVLLWLAFNVLAQERTPDQARSKHGILLYLSLTMIVSYSFLSIKTAALTWFFIGAVQSSGQSPRRDRSPV